MKTYLLTLLFIVAQTTACQTKPALPEQTSYTPKQYQYWRHHRATHEVKSVRARHSTQQRNFAVVQGRTVTIKWNANDPSEHIREYRVYNDQIHAGTVTSGTQITLPRVPIGPHVITVTAVSVNGMEGEPSPPLLIKVQQAKSH